MQKIRDLINLAILDSNVKGGLRWPLRQPNSVGHYTVVGVWRTKTEAYSSLSIRLRLREADRFDFLTLSGEVTREVVLKLTGINRNLLVRLLIPDFFRSNHVDFLTVLAWPLVHAMKNCTFFVCIYIGLTSTVQRNFNYDLQEQLQKSEALGVLAMVDDAMKLIRTHFLAWNDSLVS